MSKARDRWSEAAVEWEGTVGDKRADVLVRFDELDDRHGAGVAIECQYRNEGKDIKGTEADFLESGYSVLWLVEDGFDGMDVDLNSGRWVLWWPRQVPPVAEWSGFHGVVKWLRQTNYSTVEMEIPEFPTCAPVRFRIHRAWRSGYAGPVPDLRFRGENPDIELAREVRRLMERSRRSARSSRHRRRGGPSERQLSKNCDSQVQKRRENWRHRTIDYTPHPNAGLRPETSGECQAEHSRDWCLGPEAGSVVYQCSECNPEVGK